MDDLVTRLRNPVDSIETMKAWDSWRKYVAKGGGGSWPRDAFECLISGIDEERVEAADCIQTLTAELAHQHAINDELLCMLERVQMRAQPDRDWVGELLRWEDGPWDIGAPRRTLRMGSLWVGEILQFDGKWSGRTSEDRIIGEFAEADARAAVEKAVQDALRPASTDYKLSPVAENTSDISADPARTCETCRHSPDGEPVPASDRCSICRAAHGLLHWAVKPNTTSKDDNHG